MTQNPPDDPQEIQEWLDALDAVVDREGIERAHVLIEALIDKARRAGANLPFKATTAYVNTIHPNAEARSPADHELEYRIRSYVRWNAMAMVVRTNAAHHGLGGHIST
ncbi:MAG TPA: pyruvate dehydrogenase (acetyl-transferring), homodimeric type, partial [Polyangiales bacterium]|nr:pyruvate dehydrogenase (acetyl-transferring), homodimeric type [Polyangiales bacterium]